MPYADTSALPASVRKALPAHAQTIYLAAFNAAYDEYRDRGAEEREQTAHKVAWAAVKKQYEKSADGAIWQARA